MKTKTKQVALPHGEQFLRRAVRIAAYYGFSPAEETVRLGKNFSPRGIDLKSLESELRLTLGIPAGVALASYFARSERQPMMFYHVTSNATALSFGLDIVGVPQSMAEALLIKTALVILEEFGLGGMRVHINSVGDRDSLNRFTRELQLYLRKHIEELPARGRELMKRDVLASLTYLAQKSPEVYEGAPKPMEFLSEASRRHLREMLEYLETAEIPYEVNNSLIPANNMYSQTIFEIRRPNFPEEGGEELLAEEETLARGGRYDEVLRRAGRSGISAVRLLMGAPCRNKMEVVMPRPSQKPKVYFIQLGLDARIRSLGILDLLRKAHVSLTQSIGTDTLAGQLSTAERLSVPYAIIMGQKEALEKTVIVRNLSSRRQDTVPIAVLPIYIKQIGL